MLGLYLTKAGSWFLVVHTLLKICNVVILICKLPDQPKRLLFTSISRLGFCLPNFFYVLSGIWQGLCHRQFHIHVSSVGFHLGGLSYIQTELGRMWA